MAISCTFTSSPAEAGARRVKALTLCLQVQGRGPMLGVYETACDVLLDMSEACRATGAGTLGEAGVGDYAQAVTLGHWREACPGLYVQAKKG